ncbi:50S ribosomal protein L21, mitochondrial [Pistacia vera]|uniref:50S ribosomal protein L21, mitochondrial n=1 Tax=Pistacia vera TaxID=55513 RepID=UPI001263BE34|nr:50S ribosomal protein L21, mitochondrial [Pistacia vera]
MAHRRCLHTLSRQAAALISLKTPAPSVSNLISFKTLTRTQHQSHLSSKLGTSWSTPWYHSRHFCSNKNDDDEGDGDETGESSGEEEDDDTVPELLREYTVEETEAEAAEIGYKVVGPLQKSDRVFKPYEPVFAVVQIGSHQFKVSNGDSIFTERLKFCEVNDKLILNKVLLLGSESQTIVGRPIVPDATVHAVVEEHALDAKVIIFKKKRRKNYRRTKGHRQELTKLRIIDIQGIEKPEKEKVAVAA